jgi:2-haloacid dehalogenase
VSVDEVGVFNPAPETYWHFAERAESVPYDTWLISSNSFDVIGAKAAGIKAAWVRRDPKRVFDPWGVEPDLIVGVLTELRDVLPQ